MITPVLDHLVLDVHGDMDAAAAQYRLLGFTLTERGYHTLGSINHLAMFDTDYLELLGWPDGGTGRAELRDYPRGMNGLVFKTDDADETFAHLQAAGIAAAPPRAFSRPVEVDGIVRDAKFRTVYVAPDQSLLGRVYFCEHLTPDLVWRPEWQRHANGAAAIEAVVVAATATSAIAGLFQKMFGDDVVQQDGERFVMSAGRPTIEIVPFTSLGSDGADPAGRPHFIASLRLAGSSGGAIAAKDAGNIQLEFAGPAGRKA